MSTVVRNPGQTGNQPETSTFHYDLLGRPDYSELPNAVVEDFTFDNLDRLDVMRQYVSDADNVDLTDNAIRAHYDYTYRADGKRTALSETFQLSPSGERTTDYAWAYDAAGRLTSETLDSSDNTLDQTESYILDLVGNRLRRTIDKPSTANDRTDVVTLDTSDRLLTEQRYANLTGTGTPIETTTYTWNGTQQASKAVAIPSTSTVTQTMSYGLTGQLERVITETKNGSNVVTARTQVEYRYDASGLRCVAVDSSDSNLTTTGIERVENGRTEYLLDHNNATGYGQTVIETVKNSAGQATQRTSFTFGADEITQTVSTLNPSTGAVTATATHALGHDGHGSVRVLFDAAAAVNQVFTYSAYGEFLAIHNGAGVRTSGTAAALASPGDALTKQLYNGENLDSRTGLYNFRARWYAASSGRFERLDPYAGNPLDPFSFHKYGFVHGDPVHGIDPSGLEYTIGGMLGAIGIQGFNFGKSGLAGYAAKTAGITALQTGFEYFITQQIYNWFLPGQQDDTDWKYTYATNYISNFATGGLKAAFHVKFIIDTLTNTISDVSIGKFSWLSLAVRAVVFAGSEGLRRAGTKLIAKYADDVADTFPRGSLSKVFDGHVVGQGFTGVIDSLKKKLLLVPSTYDDVIPDNWVPARSGHGPVSQMLGGNTANMWGFAAKLQADGSLHVTWLSGVLNQTPDRAVPEAFRRYIVDAIEATTGRKVSQF